MSSCRLVVGRPSGCMPHKLGKRPVTGTGLQMQERSQLPLTLSALRQELLVRGHLCLHPQAQQTLMTKKLLIKTALTSVSEKPRPDSPHVTFSRNSLNINFILASSSFSSSILALFIHDGLLLWTMTALRTCSSSSVRPRR